MHKAILVKPGYSQKTDWVIEGRTHIENFLICSWKGDGLLFGLDHDDLKSKIINKFA